MGSYENSLQIGFRKQEGIFYSPNFITNYIITETVNEYLESKGNGFGTLQNIKILDLACGAGAFLVESFDFLLQKYQAFFPNFSNPEKWIIENNLFGVDLDKNAVEICKQLLLEKSGFICENIKQGNSLIDDKEIDERAFDWKKEFPKAKDGFDLIVGNPPWGAFLEEKNWLKNKYPHSSFGEINSYKYFIDKSLDLLKNQGTLSFILPDSYLEKEYFSDVRKLIVQNSALIKNLRFGDNIFKDVNLPSSILTLKKEKSEFKKFLFADIAKENLKNKIAILESNRKKIVFQSQEPDFERSFISRSCFFRKGNYLRLIDLYDQVIGVKVYQIGKGKPKQTSCELENNIFIADKKLDNNYLPFVSQGIYRYFYENKNEFIKYGEWLAEPRELRYFATPKIVVREIMNSYVYATLIENEAVVKNIAGVIIQKDINYSLEYLLALLCSKLFAYCVKQESPKSDNQAFPSITSNLLKNLPIKELSLSEQKHLIEKVNRLLSLHKQVYGLQKDFLDVTANTIEKSKPTQRLEKWYKLTWNEFSKEVEKSKIKISLPKQKEWLGFFREEKEKIIPLDIEIQTLEKEIDDLVYQLYDLTAEEIKMVENG